jgi:GT2 family glycosyltransferase
MTVLFSVIIPTYHRNDLLAKCLDRLAPGIQTLSAEQYEVIVTDDGLHTTAEPMIRERYSWVKWVLGPGKGPAANRNNGVNQARGEWLAFTDDDCLPDSRWLEAYATAIEQIPSCLVFEGRTYVNRAKQSLAEVAPSNETGGYLWSCNFLIKKVLFEEIGGFDERFPYAAMEDVDLRLRLTKAGYAFSFIREAAVCHTWRLKGGWRQLKQHQQSTFIYLSIHPDERRKINSIYYLEMFLRGFTTTTIPGILRFKGKGLRQELLQHLSFLQTAFYLIGSKQV